MAPLSLCETEAIDDTALLWMALPQVSRKMEDQAASEDDARARDLDERDKRQREAGSLSLEAMQLRRSGGSSWRCVAAADEDDDADDLFEVEDGVEVEIKEDADWRCLQSALSCLCV